MVKINFVGDILLGELFSSVGRGVKTKIEQGIDPFNCISNQLKTADLNVGNLECVLSSKSNRHGIYRETMRGKPEYAKLLVDNIQIVNLANNHVLDHGREAFLEMEGILKKNNISFFGDPENIDNALVILTRDDTKIGFLGFDLSNKKYEELNKIKNEINKTIIKSKASVDILVLSIHWGLEYVESPIDWQVIFSKDFLNSGADIIHGHHSHRFQGYIKENRKLIMFSLGNFIFDDRRKLNCNTGIIEVNIEEKKIQSVSVIPLIINKNYQPEFIDNNKMEKKYKQLNEICSRVYNSDSPELENITKKYIKNSRKNHMFNRIYIVYNLTVKFYKYLPKIYSTDD